MERSLNKKSLRFETFSYIFQIVIAENKNICIFITETAFGIIYQINFCHVWFWQFLVETKMSCMILMTEDMVMFSVKLFGLLW